MRALAALALACAGCYDFGSYGGFTDGGLADAADPIDLAAASDLARGDACLPDPATCKGKCGQVLDRCGAQVDCGGCPEGQTCGGGGPSVCGTGACTPTTCTASGKNCGPLFDDCSVTLDCGSCAQPDQCGGGGLAGVCGCTATTCAKAGAGCGPLSDGCGGALDCGGCGGGKVCIDNQCAAPPACTPTSQVCDPVCNSGCGNGQRCDMNLQAQKTGVCFDTGGGQLGDACNLSLSSDSCAPKLACDGTSCIALCWRDTDCPLATQCCDAHVTYQKVDIGFLVCRTPDACDPISNTGCLAGTSCYTAGCAQSPDSVACLPTGTVVLGTNCGGDTTCVPGAWCTEDTKRCETLCLLAKPACAQGQSCVPLLLADDKHHAIRYGTCR